MRSSLCRDEEYGKNCLANTSSPLDCGFECLTDGDVALSESSAPINISKHCIKQSVELPGYRDLDNPQSGTAWLPTLLRRYVLPGDQVIRWHNADSPILVCSVVHRHRQLLYAQIGSAAALDKNARESESNVLTQIVGTSGPRQISIPSSSVGDYFYRSSGPQESLYAILNCANAVATPTLRYAWRLKSVADSVLTCSGLTRLSERAFNILANPELRAAYDRHLLNHDNALPFPYGACGEIVVTGKLSADESTFVADVILAYRPQLKLKQIAVLLRQCEFLKDQILFRDSRRGLNICLDTGLMNGLTWDPTWNRWKRWLRSRLNVSATFVRSSRPCLRKSEEILRDWWTALPSRISVTVPASVHEDVARAQAIHELLGQHAEVLQKLREQIARQPVEASVVQAWLDRLGASPQLKPEYTTWQPDYEDYFFGQLRKRASTWFLFRDEYLFILPSAIVSDVPSAGHAAYVFAAPRDQEGFLRLYCTVTRNDVRRNRLNVAAELGFIGRVVRGTKRKRWLADVLKLAGEHANYLDAVED